MNLQDMIRHLLDSGYSQVALARKLTDSGAHCTQPTIWRILNGKVEPKYTLGAAIRALYEESLSQDTAA